MKDTGDKETGALKATESQTGADAAAPKRTVSLVAAVFNLIKSAVGVGTLFLHRKLADLGFAAGLGAIFVAAFMSTLSLHLLSRMAHNCDTGDYFVLGRLALGSKGERVTAVALLLFLFAGLSYYTLFVGDYVRQTLEHVWSIPRTENVMLTTVLPTLLCMFPISCLRDLSALAVTSVVGMVSMLGVTGLVVSNYFTSQPTPSSLSMAAALNSENHFGPDGWTAFGGIIFAFVNHFTVVSLCPVLQQPTPARRCTLISVSTAACLAVYLPCAICGYLTFGAGLEQTILDVPNNHLFAVARAFVALVITVSFPLLLDPARSTLAALLPFPDSTGRHLGLTLALTLAPLLTVLAFGWEADSILSLISALCGSLLVFIAPGVFFLSLQGKMVVHGWERITAYALIAFGLLTLVTGSYSCGRVLVEKISSFLGK